MARKGGRRPQSEPWKAVWFRLLLQLIKPGVAKTIKNTRYPALSISNEWNPPEVDDGRTTTTGERREWLKRSARRVRERAAG